MAASNTSSPDRGSHMGINGADCTEARLTALQSIENRLRKVDSIEDVIGLPESCCMRAGFGCIYCFGPICDRPVSRRAEAQALSLVGHCSVARCRARPSDQRTYSRREDLAAAWARHALLLQPSLRVQWRSRLFKRHSAVGHPPPVQMADSAYGVTRGAAAATRRRCPITWLPPLPGTREQPMNMEL